MVGSVLEGFERIGFNDTDSRQAARCHAEFQSWLFGLRRGLQPLGMSSRARPSLDLLHIDNKDRFTAEKGWMGEEIEPMPVLV